MSNTIKRSLVVTLILVLLIAFAGCGSLQNQTSGKTKKEVNDKQVASEDANDNSDISKTDNTDSADIGDKSDSDSHNDNGNGSTPSGENKKSIVVYFSRTNNTERIAGFIKELTDSDSYEILAKVPYTDADINYNNSSSRTSIEQNDSSSRPEIGSETIDLSLYDIIYLGYPIWHGQAPKIMYTFAESYDLSGKTIVPFCTSASSGIGSSATNLSASAPAANWISGKRFSSSSSKSEVSTWLSGLNLEQKKTSEGKAESATSNQTVNGDKNVTLDTLTSDSVKESDDAGMRKELHMYINDTEVSVAWQNNDSVNALIELVSTNPLIVQMSMYGGFEQVGSLGTSLPRNDKQTTTEAGDIVLYSGNQIVVFYGSNSWSYTRLGKITDKSASELISLLGNGNVKITISYKE